MSTDAIYMDNCVAVKININGNQMATKHVELQL